MTRPPLRAHDDSLPTAHRSYKARQGRISDLTAGTIAGLWPRFGVGAAPTAGSNPIPGQAPIVDLHQQFGDGAHVVLELGSGMGDATVAMAAADPSTSILAVEVHLRGVARLMRAAAERDLSNVKVASCDGQALLAALPEQSLVGVRVYFPDPWPKARHHKRRLVRPEFVAEVARVLLDGGTVHLATDWIDYAQSMREVFDASDALVSTATSSSGFVERPQWRPVTRYEQAGLDKGHVVNDLIYQRLARTDAP